VSAVGHSLPFVELGWSAVVARRMQRQGLAGEFPDIEAAVSAMGGAHAQMMSAAELSIGVRVESATPEQIRAALWPGGTLIKTYGPRGTVHLLPRSELSLWCAALGAVPTGSSLPTDARLNADQTSRVLEAISEALTASSPLDGDELSAAVVARLGAWAADPVVPAFGGWWPRWRQAISLAAHRGVLAFGDNRGSRVTYVNPGVPVETDSRAALAWLLRRYLTTYGPATAEHYGRWLGVRKAWATEQFALYSADLEAVTVEGQLAYVVSGDIAASANPLRRVTLLPHFDPYVIGSFPRDRLFPGMAATRALGRGQAGVHPVLLVDGIVAGVWGARRVGSVVTVTVESFSPLSNSNRVRLASAAERIGALKALDTRLVLGEVTAGAHK
jgi:hypothetical protein